MPTHPLTHHEIITLVAPFTRQGYHPDLQATDRLERRLVFKPVDREFKTSNAGDLSESLQLENRDGKTFRRLVSSRVSRLRMKKLEAKLDIEGTDPADLLACVELSSRIGNSGLGQVTRLQKAIAL